METNVRIDLLRMALLHRGHINPRSLDDAGEDLYDVYGRTCKEEYLIGLLSHDESLERFLVSYQDTLKGVVNTIASFEAIDFDAYVECVRLVWLESGVSAVLDFIRNVGFVTYCHIDSRHRREAINDNMVSIVYGKLKSSGLKHRDLAEFFSDRVANAQLKEYFERRNPSAKRKTCALLRAKSVRSH